MIKLNSCTISVAMLFISFSVWKGTVSGTWYIWDVRTDWRI